MRQKKGDLSLEVIVVAVLCIVVMVVLIYIFGGKVGLFNASTTCTARAGTCMQQMPSTTCGTDSSGKEKPIMIWTQDCKCAGDSCKDQLGKSPGQCCVGIG